MMGLTPKQRELLDVITERMAVDGVCPSYRELMAATGHASTSAISRLVGGLEERGYSPAPADWRKHQRSCG